MQSANTLNTIIRGNVDLGDGKIYYEVAGAGETLVLSHAAFLDSRMFDALMPTLTQKFRVVRYDMRGFGQSSPATQPVCRRDDLRRLLGHLEIGRAHMVGCSMGGEIMLDLAIEQPELVASVTTVCSTPSGFEMVGESPRYIMEMVAAAQAGDLDTMNELQIRIWLDGMYREPNEVDADLRAKALAMNRIPVAQSTFFIADTQPANPLIPAAQSRLSEVACPVLAIVGNLDHPELLRATDDIARGVQNGRKIIMEGTAHVPSYEQPEAFMQILLDFLGDSHQMSDVK